jgi:GDPmannose 4,6-dehydratase
MRVLITGVSGQDGSYLAERLGAEGHELHGTTTGDAVPDGVFAHRVDLSEPGVGDVIRTVRPDLIVNLAALSSVAGSWRAPLQTAAINATAVAEMLAAVAELTDAGTPTRFVQASSAEIFGAATQVPQTESTQIRPTSPYGASKAYAQHLVGVYRAAGVWASACILYNHESPRRPEVFVTRKITAAAARIAAGRQDALQLGTLDSRRDWGWAPDTVDALVRAAAAERPDDYVIATGEDHSVREFVEIAFERVGIQDWESVVSIDPTFQRPVDPPQQVGDASKARAVLGWAPTVDFRGIVEAMVDADVRLLADG